MDRDVIKLHFYVTVWPSQGALWIPACYQYDIRNANVCPQ